MKRASDITKWDGSGFRPDAPKPREPFGRAMNRREAAFDNAPVDAMRAMARVAGSMETRPWAVRGWLRNGGRYTKYLAIGINPTHAAIWSPEKGIRVVPMTYDMFPF